MPATSVKAYETYAAALLPSIDLNSLVMFALLRKKHPRPTEAGRFLHRLSEIHRIMVSLGLRAHVRIAIMGRALRQAV